MFSETKQPPCQVSHPRPAASSLPRARRVGGQRCGQEAEASPEGTYPLQLHLRGGRGACTLSPKPVSTRGTGQDQAL